ncbi:MAG: hypothetical protein HOH43_06980 [Candidatus Latescibacteria bacterium]|jgi:hypothetical protein|nr:hypothetical protein [Candidatus Latescibacterota bacterium]
MPDMFSKTEEFLSLFAAGRVDDAASMIATYSDVFDQDRSLAHPLLRAFVESNDGHCYKAPHMSIAEMLTPSDVLRFRDAVVADDLLSVRSQLAVSEYLVGSEFPAGRGISQAIHHWVSLNMGRLILGAGADIDVLTSRGESPVGMQLRFGTIEGAELLLEAGADPNNGIGAHMPSRSLEPMIELLLRHGWDINRGQMLHDANHGHGVRVMTWLKYGADPNSVNELGETALHLFAKRGTGRKAIEALITGGANTALRDGEGQTPLDVARKAKQNAAARALAEHDSHG